VAADDRQRRDVRDLIGGGDDDLEERVGGEARVLLSPDSGRLGVPDYDRA
jgi:hypothetical protein